MAFLDEFRLDGKVALVTGGGGILGQRFSLGLSEAGANVVVVDVNLDAAKTVAESLPTSSLAVQCDVANPESVKACIDEVVNYFGHIDVLLNNAATKTGDVRAFFAPFEEYSIDVWREVMSVNIDGMFLMAQAVGKQMLQQGCGSIIQTASIYGESGPDNRIYEGSEYLGGPINTPAVYSASKAAVIGLTKWLATHWAENSIRTNCLVPGGVSSGQNSIFSEKYSQRVPLRRMASADEMVPMILYLASDASSYVTGQVMNVDGGLSTW